MVLAAAMDAAAKNDRAAAMKLLIDAGADPNAPREGSKDTPLHAALMAGHVDCVQVLADANAATYVQNSDRLMACELAVGGLDSWIANQKESRGNSPLADRLESFRAGCECGRKRLLSQTGWSNVNLT